jgi:benzoyl-CoA reductase/2-hydroxyglutaryl-CoA dehydratase subunit BcrC/BadD/HgdB
VTVALVDWNKATTSRLKVKHLQIRGEIVEMLESCKTLAKVYKDCKIDISEVSIPLFRINCSKMSRNISSNRP